MSLTQLNPPLPVYAQEKGKGLAHAVIDYGPEHNLIWVTAIDATGEVWCVPNPLIRMQTNWTMGRQPDGEEHPTSPAEIAPLEIASVAP